MWAAVLYLGHKQGAGVDDVYEVSQTAEEGALQEATLKLRSRVSVSVCPDTTKQEGRRPSESVVSWRNIFNGSLFNLFYNQCFTIRLNLFRMSISERGYFKRGGCFHETLECDRTNLLSFMFVTGQSDCEQDGSRAKLPVGETGNTCLAVLN